MLETLLNMPQPVELNLIVLASFTVNVNKIVNEFYH